MVVQILARLRSLIAKKKPTFSSVALEALLRFLDLLSDKSSIF